MFSIQNIKEIYSLSDFSGSLLGYQITLNLRVCNNTPYGLVIYFFYFCFLQKISGYYALD